MTAISLDLHEVPIWYFSGVVIRDSLLNCCYTLLLGVINLMTPFGGQFFGCENTVIV
jgi:hypothetical protein